MAIARSGSAATGAVGGPVSSVTWSHTVPAVANSLLYVQVCHQSGTSVTCTYNGVAMTELWDITAGPNGTAGYLLVIASPDGSAHNVVASFATNADVAGGSSIAYTGVDPTTPNRTPATATGATTTAAVTVSNAVSGDRVVDGVSVQGTTITIDGSQTVIIEDDAVAASSSLSAGSSEKAATGSTTMQWTQGIADNWSIGAAALIPEVASGQPTMRRWYGVPFMGGQGVGGSRRAA